MVNFDGLTKELREALQDIMMMETTCWLIKSLLKAKLSTWDIYYFARNQASLRTTIKDIDWYTIRAALKAKLGDILITLKALRRKKSKLEVEMRD